jgi:Flp pilus assembly protein TadB
LTTSLDDPEEREIAEGFGRRERRGRARIELVLLAVLVLAVALMLAGLTDSSTVTLVIAVYTVVRWPVESLRDRQIKRRLGEARTGPPDTATAG